MDTRLLLAIMDRKLRNVDRFLAIRYTVLKAQNKISKQSDINFTTTGYKLGKDCLKMLYSPICVCEQRSSLYIIQTVYLGFYFILCSCKA
jgi:hypothetical protein